MTDTELVGRIELEAPPEPRTWLVIENPIPHQVADRLRAQLEYALAHDQWPIILTGVGPCYWLTERSEDA